MTYGRSLLAALVMAATSVHAVHAQDSTIDLKLFGEHEIEGGLSACHLALWQHNRDPETDKFAYVFYMPFNEDGSSAAGEIEIGRERVSLLERARGDVDPQTRLGYRLFTSSNDATSVVLHIQEVTETSSSVRIEQARVTVVQDDFPPFSVKARGILGCPGSGEAAYSESSASEVASSGYQGPEGLSFGNRQDLVIASDVPRAVRDEMAAYASDQCDLAGEKAYAGAKYAVSDDFLLWEVPCFLGAYQGSSAFAITQNPPQEWAMLLSFPNPPALEGNNILAAMNPEVLPERGLIYSTDYARGSGDCGTHQVFRLMDAPGESFELELMEYREKLDCDGVESDPHTWPLQFSAR